MKLETFFEKFELFADAPGAVGKMRELVLDLAVKGKLVEQNPADEPASELLERLIPAQRRRQAAPLPPLQAEESQYELPDGWTWARFRDVAIIASNLVKPADFLEFTHLAPDNIEKGSGVLLPCRTVREDNVISSNHRFYPGQIVYSKIRPNLAKVVVVDFDGLCSADMYPIDALIDVFYLHRYMLSESFLVQAVKSDTRVAMPKINQMELNAIAVPVPPLAEQKRIVAKVDELMALCDRLEAQQQDRETRHAALARASLARFADAPTLDNLNFLFHPSYSISPAELRKAILTLAVQGKLVPQNLKDETAQALLYHAVCSAKTRRQMADELDETDAPFSIPDTWAWVRLPRVLKKLTDGTHHSPPNGPSGAFMYVTAKNIKTDGVFLDGISYVSKEVHDEIYSRCDPSFGDILYIKDGATTGVATINQVKEPFSMLSSVALLKPSEVVFNRYLLWAMRSPFFYSETRGAMKGAAITRVTLSVMAGSLLPLPPLAEQHRIVAKVEQLMALVDELEAQLAASRAAAANLLAALVAELTGTPAGRVATPTPATPIAPAPRPKALETPVAPVTPAEPKSSPRHRTLADLRKAAGLNQAAVAQAMGLNQAYISQMETGKRAITEEQRAKLAEVLGATEEELP